jgi:hypothetical protein
MSMDNDMSGLEVAAFQVPSKAFRISGIIKQPEQFESSHDELGE